ncbi:vacuolar protein sorting-associated protein 52, putative [Plasmodium berghei]|uniref:Vacuolar protein sorting-associated protein 52, putative n=3 Tax=Plasmodium berghei TaxID=5821 RepID=A0A509AQC8_PLABA|nr:vacuolar protein sorting-associated protein 52, putative [Plasmodium berghei ANKA]CXI98383.1 vacuolar protein sorting-associated protein 52, putative [Plasmodium berghei]SCM18461.1 vacuolar protein sorting-associated protein 52, putative [Plasmodium berghei]VUC57776.1 vacuolar protein sorting-associated protein 52, putative [Plasmodium berghei ANKA]|eukprot:XP_034423546.1 vacuolar protein sorting-associated protein 52, putative [Plasmodium berghei ANKA]
MEYEELSNLIKKFKGNPQVLKAFENIYVQNNCNFYSKIKIDDIEKGEILNEKKKETEIVNDFKNSKKEEIENDKLKDYEKITNKNFYMYTEQILKKLVKENDEINKTYDEIEKCNNAYNDIDIILNKYKNNIKDISNGIKNIENLTNNLDDKIQNRKQILELLNVYIKIILITPQLTNDITNNEIDDMFIKNIHILNKKIENCRHCLYDSYPSINASYNELEKLKYKATNKIYNFFLSQLNDILNKKTSIYIIQKNLIKYHILNTFLYNNNKNAYTYIIKKYITILNKTYYNLFKAYISNFIGKQIHFNSDTTIGKCSPLYFQDKHNNNLGNANNCSTNYDTTIQSSFSFVDATQINNSQNCSKNYAQNDGSGIFTSSIIGIGEVGSSSIVFAKNKMMDMFGFSFKNKNISDKSENFFLLNNRHNVLDDIKNVFFKNLNNDKQKGSNEHNSISTISISNNTIYYFEHIYKLINKLFIDTGTSEYIFILNFFKNYENIDFLFLEIYSKTISLCFNYFINFINTTFDFISLFIIYIINIYNAYIIKNRHILSLYEFVEKIQNIVWNKIHYIINENYKSIIITINPDNLEFTKLDQNQIQNKKTVYDLLYRTQVTTSFPINNIENKFVQIYDEKKVRNPKNELGEIKTETNINEHNQVYITPQYNTELKTNNIYNNEEINDITPKKSTNLSNPLLPTHIKPDVHSITKSFSDFYSSLIILNKLAYDYEFMFRKKCSEGKQTNENGPKNGSKNGSENGSENGLEKECQNRKPNSEALFNAKGKSYIKYIEEEIHNELINKYVHLNNFISNFENMIINVLLNLSNNFQNTNDQLLFLINNYYHIITILKNNKINEDKINPFEKLIEKNISYYIDLQLNKYIKDIIFFVSKHEHIFENIEEQNINDITSNSINNYSNNNVNILSQIDIQLMESTALFFTNKWKELLKTVEQEILKSFSNRVNSINILKTLNTKILLHFTRYQQLIKQIFKNSEMPLSVPNLPSIDIILTQIKKNLKHLDNEGEYI